jgi:hypothetical protein
MSVPSCSFKTKMMLPSKVVMYLSSKGNAQEDSSHNYMETMESSSHVKYGTINSIINTEWSRVVFERLASGKNKSEGNSHTQRNDGLLPVSGKEGSMSPGNANS